MPVITTVETEERIMNGKPILVTITRHDGLATYHDHGREILADKATFIDYGPKYGVTRCFTIHEDREVTEEERARNRARINEAANAAMRARGIWK